MAQTVAYESSNIACNLKAHISMDTGERGGGISRNRRSRETPAHLPEWSIHTPSRAISSPPPPSFFALSLMSLRGRETQDFQSPPRSGGSGPFRVERKKFGEICLRRGAPRGNRSKRFPPSALHSPKAHFTARRSLQQGPASGCCIVRGRSS